MWQLSTTPHFTCFSLQIDMDRTEGLVQRRRQPKVEENTEPGVEEREEEEDRVSMRAVRLTTEPDLVVTLLYTGQGQQGDPADTDGGGPTAGSQGQGGLHQLLE